MVGFPASGPKRACSPGRVSTPLLLKTTSWQSGETPCGSSEGDRSVTRPPKISMGASNDPAVVISCIVHSLYDICSRKARFGEYFQWGYWTRLRSVEGLLCSPGVRVSHSPHRPSTRPD